jgi:ABC-2 type transport system permease protein
VVQALVITLVAIPFGFVFYPLHVVVGLVMLGIFGVGVGALSYALAIAARKTEWIFWAVQQSLLFPLLILSGMMLPLETGPGWMQVVSKFNPLTYIVDAERVLFAGTFGSLTILWGFVAAFATAAVGLVVGIRSIRKATI